MIALALLKRLAIAILRFYLCISLPVRQARTDASCSVKPLGFIAHRSRRSSFTGALRRVNIATVVDESRSSQTNDTQRSFQFAQRGCST